MSAHFFIDKDFPSAFEALSVVYMDSFGFFDEKEQKALEKIFTKCKESNDDFIDYNKEYGTRGRKTQGMYEPPKDIYMNLIEFRTTLMKTMAKHNMLMAMVSKSQAGAGGR